MGRFVSVALALYLAGSPLFARGNAIADSCGTSRETPRQNMFLHRQAVRARAASPRLAVGPVRPGANRDMGAGNNIAVIEDVDGVTSTQNPFDLNNTTLTFTPVTAGYSYSTSGQTYDSAAATNGAPLTALDDDDTRQVSLPFSFPFYGSTYSSMYVNSDGNITFTAGDNATDRSLGRMNAGPPRISPLFEDLNPAQTNGGVRVLSEPGRVVVSWVAVPEYVSSGAGAKQTFQVRLYPDGRIEFAYSGAASTGSVVGIGPGNLKGSSTLVDFLNDTSGTYSGTVAEWFASGQAIDLVTVAQKFYQTHEDSYDYLVVYNAENILANSTGAVAFENTVRSRGTGYGVDAEDDGQIYGSASRLQAMLNMGPLSQYSADPYGAYGPGRPGDTTLSVLAHEVGHLFLAFANLPDRQMLGYQGAHWSFLFNSNASFLEGEEIVDNVSGADPIFTRRFFTRKIVQHYSALDQYLMGIRAPETVDPTFAVANPNPVYSNTRHPASGVQFDGTKQNILIGDVIGAMGRRTPDYTVAQRGFRFAFIVIVKQGDDPSAAVQQLDAYRQQFEPYYATAADGNASADTSLKRSMKFSMFPAAGVVAGAQATATLTLKTAPTADMTVKLEAANGSVAVPASVTIPAGATSATFPISGVSKGVSPVTATPVDQPYETVLARIQVADAGMLKLAPVSGTNQTSPAGAPLPNPIVVRLTDANDLPYAGARLLSMATAGGSVTPPAVTTDARGQASFSWTPGPAAVSQLTLALESAPSVALTLASGTSAPAVSSVVNAASSVDGAVAGALAVINGFHFTGGASYAAQGAWPTTLGGVSATLNGNPLQIYFAGETQAAVFIPPDAALGSGTLAVTSPAGTAPSFAVNIAATQPGIFPGAVLIAGTVNTAVANAVTAGDYIEIYCTGLGPTTASGSYFLTAHTTTVFVGSSPAEVQYSGLAPGFAGLYQVNVRIPSGLAPGSRPVVISIDGQQSNSVSILVK